MGAEQRCVARFGDQKSEGKALLETSELIFRGDVRRTIPFHDMKSVKAVDGELRIELPEGTATFFLDSQAEKWAHKILHPKSVIEKLGVKGNYTVSVIGVADPDFLEQLKPRVQALVTKKPAKDSDAIFLMADSKSQFSKIKTLARSLKKDGALWIVYPKGQKHITEGEVLSAGRKAGLKDVKVVSFSPTRTALKFVIPLSKR